MSRLSQEGLHRPRGYAEIEPVKEFMGDHIRLSGTLLNLLRQERAEAAAALVAGGVKDFAEYRNRCGFIEGLDVAIALCEQSQKQL